MADDLRRALQAAGNEFKTVRGSLEQARDALQPLMVAALRAGLAQREVVELSGYTRESVRALARKNGIAPR